MAARQQRLQVYQLELQAIYNHYYVVTFAQRPVQANIHTDHVAQLR